MINSYPTVFAIGHRAVQDILSGPVVVEEKVDGSQFSMSLTDSELACRSKGQQIIVSEPERLFQKAVETAKSLPLHSGWVYRCEYLAKPKHNTLAYSRIPAGCLVLLDVEIAEQQYMTPMEKTAEAQRLGLECVPLIYEGRIESMEQVRAMMDRESFLGGAQIEGVVVKNYAVFTPEKKVAVAKFVSEAFKEVHGVEWKKSNPTSTDVIALIMLSLRTPARWQKAVQHLREAGALTDTPADIGALVKEAQADITKEERDSVAEQLLAYALPKILRGSVRGLPEWYKDQLAQAAFKPSEEAVETQAH